MLKCCDVLLKMKKIAKISTEQRMMTPQASSVASEAGTISARRCGSHNDFSIFATRGVTREHSGPDGKTSVEKEKQRPSEWSSARISVFSHTVTYIVVTPVPVWSSMTICLWPFQVLEENSGPAGPLCRLWGLPLLLRLQRKAGDQAVHFDAPRLLRSQRHVADCGQGQGSSWVTWGNLTCQVVCFTMKCVYEFCPWIVPVPPKASAHCVCGHARPRGDDAH